MTLSRRRYNRSSSTLGAEKPVEAGRRASQVLDDLRENRLAEMTQQKQETACAGPSQEICVGQSEWTRFNEFLMLSIFGDAMFSLLS